jgi:hypothetical protein
MKKYCAILLLVLVLVICKGCDSAPFMPSIEESNAIIAEVEAFFWDNEELFNRIKDGLFSSDFVPHDGLTGEYRRSATSGRYFPIYSSELENTLWLHYNSRRERLFCSQDGGNLETIQNVQDDVIEYFIYANNLLDDFTSSIFFRAIPEIGVIVEFRFTHDPNISIATGILYKTFPDDLWGAENLTGNWYVYFDILG